MWGSHLNKPTLKRSDYDSGAEMSLKFGLDTSRMASVKTRTSLKKRSRTFQSFTETLGLSEDTLKTASSPPVDSVFKSEEENKTPGNGHDTQTGLTPQSAPAQNDETGSKVLEDDEDSLMFFPSLSAAQLEGTGKAAAVKTSVPGLRRKIDSDWLARCTGIQSVSAPEQQEEEAKEELSTAPVPVGEQPEKKKPVERAISSYDCVEPETGGGNLERVDPKPTLTLVNNSGDSNSETDRINVKKTPVEDKKSKKRKRSDESDDEYDRSQEDEEDSPPTVKQKKSKASSKKETKPRKKKTKVAKEVEADVPEKSDEPQGPSNINMFALGFEEQMVDKVIPIKKGQSAQERLESKVLSGKANDCFVKIDLKKKKFSRGKAGMSGAKIKRAEWKRKMDLKEGKKVKEMKCFRCGESGHWARQCTGGRGDSLIPVEMSEEFDAGEFPSLEQARDMASGVLRLEKENSRINSLKLFSVKQSSSSETGKT